MLYTNLIYTDNIVTLLFNAKHTSVAANLTESLSVRNGFYHDTLFGSTVHAIHRQGHNNPIPVNMSFPSPLLSPNEFLDHVRSLGLDSITTLFRHYQRRPVPSSPGGHYDMSDTHEWCDRMDTLLVSSDLSLPQ